LAIWKAVFNQALPNTQDSNCLVWMQTLSALTKLDADKFVPGHGLVGTKNDVSAFLAYFEELKSMVELSLMRGDNLEQILRDIGASQSRMRPSTTLVLFGSGSTSLIASNAKAMKKHFPRKGPHDSVKQAQNRCLPGSIRANQGHKISWVNVKGNFPQDFFLSMNRRAQAETGRRPVALDRDTGRPELSLRFAERLREDDFPTKWRSTNERIRRIEFATSLVKIISGY
jgi:hypothetical protein